MRDRLIELIGEAKAIEASGIDCKVTYEYIADYLLANGVIVLPCKPGDKLYNEDSLIDEYCYWIVERIEVWSDGIYILDDSGNCYSIDEIGKTVFLTKEEAERALKGGEQMTDNEIIKALECCAELISNPCSQCPYFHEKPCLQLKRDALDLIKRQQAQIERLEKVKALGDDLIEQLRITINNRTEENKSLELDLRAMRGAANSYKLHYGNMKAEIVREFADRLKAESGYSAIADADGGEIYGTRVYRISAECLDNLLKEMTEET